MVSRMLVTAALLANLALYPRTSLASMGQDAHPARISIVVDTDIGDDIDDAYALTLVARDPSVRLLGVTTTYGQTQKRAQIAAKLLASLGRSHVPVFAGIPGTQPIGRQYDWAQSYRSPSIHDTGAIEFLRDTVLKSPGSVTIVCIGALTNIGALLARYPQVRTAIKQIVLMGGAAFVGYNNLAPAVPEWNIRCDPAAARTVFASGVPIVMAGLDVTTMMHLDIERQKKIYATGEAWSDALCALTALWGNSIPTLFDPVAAGWALGARFCSAEPLHIEVEGDGTTRVTADPPNAQVLTEPQKDAFLDWYVEEVTTGAHVSGGAR